VRQTLSGMRWVWLVMGLAAGLTISRSWPESHLTAGVESQTGTDGTTDKKGNGESLDVRYAEAYAQLAQLQLQQALDANEKMRATFSKVLIERLRQHARIAGQLLERTRNPDASSQPDLNISSAEAELKLAEVKLQTSLALTRRVPGFEPKADLEQLRAKVEVARLRLEKARQLSGKLSLEENLQWQVNQLRDDLLELHIAFESTALVR